MLLSYFICLLVAILIPLCQQEEQPTSVVIDAVGLELVDPGLRVELESRPVHGIASRCLKRSTVTISNHIRKHILQLRIDFQ